MLRRVNYRLRAEEARRSSEEPIVYGTAVAVGEVVAAVTGVPVAPLVDPVAAEPSTPEAAVPSPKTSLRPLDNLVHTHGRTVLCDRRGHLVLYDRLGAADANLLRLDADASTPWMKASLARVTAGPYPFRGTVQVTFEFDDVQIPHDVWSAENAVFAGADAWRTTFDRRVEQKPLPEPRWGLPALYFAPKEREPLRRAVQERAIAAGFGDHWSRQRVGGREAWVLHRRPQISAREDERAPGRFVTDVSYEFTKPPKAALALALQAISKFRIGVDKDGQGVDRPERCASASFQVAKFEVLPALLAHV